jgi:hypothetical protein
MEDVPIEQTVGRALRGDRAEVVFCGEAPAARDAPSHVRDVVLESAPSPVHAGPCHESSLEQKLGRGLRVTSDSQIRSSCFACCRCHGASEKDLRCKRCGLVRYCGKACQVADWPRHKTQCATEDEIRDLLDSECRAVIDSPVFGQLARCLKEYNEELRSQQSIESSRLNRDVLGRRVGGLVTVQKLDSLPLSLRAQGGCPFTVSFSDLRREDRDAHGEPLWSFTIVPSCANVSATIEEFERLPELKPKRYERWRDEGLFDGKRSVSCLGAGELISLENATAKEVRAAGVDVSKMPELTGAGQEEGPMK